MYRRCAVGFALLPMICVLFLPACSKDEEEAPNFNFGQTVSGKVTYDGTPVNYGYVLFYEMSKFGFDPKSGNTAPVCFAKIKNGRYLIKNAPERLVQICVATDPDVDLEEVFLPKKPGQVGSEPAGGPDPGGGGFIPPDHEKDGPKLPPGFKDKFKAPIAPPIPKNPTTEKFTEEEKDRLRTIHKHYGIFGKSPLLHPVQKGNQVYDIKLLPR